MEFFQKAKVVRLRSYHDKYMLADENQENVYQDRNGCYNNAKWNVEILENSNFIRLRSCYGKYLTASNMPLIVRGTGKKVLQTLPSRLNSSLEWEPIREGVQVRLRTRYGQYLRANGGLPPWRNTITHDVPHRTSKANWVLWDVDIVELRPQPQVPRPRPRPTPITPPISRSLNPTPTDLSPSSSPLMVMSDTDLVKIDLRSPTAIEPEDSPECLSPVKEGRIIFYDVGNENGDVDDAKKEAFFTFKGSCLNELADKLKEETGLDDILVCCRNPLTAKLYPLRLQLPPNSCDMHVVVVPSSCQVSHYSKAFRYKHAYLPLHLSLFGSNRKGSEEDLRILLKQETTNASSKTRRRTLVGIWTGTQNLRAVSRSISDGKFCNSRGSDSACYGNETVLLRFVYDTVLSFGFIIINYASERQFFAVKSKEELLVVVGGGAAGMYGAIHAKTVAPHLSVVVIEKGKPLSKVKVSGGGRCNVTNGHCVDNMILAENYPRGHKELRGYFFNIHGPVDTMSWFSSHGVELKVEDDGRVFPVSNNSSSIIDCLMSEVKQRGAATVLPAWLNSQIVSLQTRKTVAAVSILSSGKFLLEVQQHTSIHAERVEADYLLIASGSSRQGYTLASQLGHSIVDPVPSLFTFKIEDSHLRELSGVTFPKVKVRLKLDSVQRNIPKLTQVGPMLVTHWGLSGPVILRLSAWGARFLFSSSYKGKLFVDFIPDLHVESLKSILSHHKLEYAKQKVLNSCPPEFGITRRFWSYVLERQGLSGDALWASISNSSLMSIGSLLKHCIFEVTGKGQFKDEFVTAGGVPLSEILNVDGVTGGFNFQNAWSGGFIAGTTIGGLALGSCLDATEAEPIAKMAVELAEKVKIGVCVMEKKVKCHSEVLSFITLDKSKVSDFAVFSAPMGQIFDRLQAFGEFEVIHFGDKVILEDPIERYYSLIRIAEN
ncbi:unnamed protein product [Sphenostylis stenocarpa]|uniref:DUF569 domain-containing protein n=1 Tax=Sphenostylis stenocarpa TaxID=92480 RepID=A0AA86T0B0_9FABA|nr:unnamed protein product [Sphenostylis stenocarpa]